jgi:phage repressor protein C with HTH and peptisase S24 domain
MRFGFNEIWRGIDNLAKNKGMSVSGLAGAAGLNPTTFNKSKRIGADGKKRWPSTESVNKILEATDTSVLDFLVMASGQDKGFLSNTLPLLYVSLASKGDFFDEKGCPIISDKWDGIDFFGGIDKYSYVLEVDNEDNSPLYRIGDRLVISPSCDCRAGDRVAVMTKSGLIFKYLKRRTAMQTELQSLLSDDKEILPNGEILWIAKILWVSQ